MSATPIWDATVRAWNADRVDALFADLRAYVGLANPLCLDADQRCPRCGGRLNTVGPDTARRVEPCVVCEVAS